MRSYLCGLGLIALGEGLRIWGVGYLGGGSRGLEVSASSLVTSGPFAHVRNPLYLGNLFLGFVIAAWAWIPYFLFLFAAAFAMQYIPIVRLEESHLALSFGPAFLAYRREVPAFLPRLTPYAERSAHRFSLRSALRSERRTLQSIALLLLAILIRRWVFPS
jgi:protein-S-isoprenylcysteine O-methyltransferase Ste14